MKQVLLSIILGCCPLLGSAQYALLGESQSPFTPQIWGDWQTWGEQPGDMYVNPVLPGDYSDIDCIEHDGYYYAISSTFQFEPGMVILRSTDMVNWRVYSHAVPDITQISDGQNWTVMDRYARGIWAGAIRHHNGKFYVYFGCPDEGMFMTTSKKIEGPWAPLTKMNIDGGWDDCCPLFDEDGQNYFVATHFAGGYKTYVFPLSKDGKTVDWDKKVLINEGYGREASKLYKWNGKYYHMFSEDRDGGRYLVMQRSDSPMGPYNERHRLSHTQREWNEPNQGGYLQDKDGNWFFLTHHGHGDWGGREGSLLPVTWTEDGWPVIGRPDRENVGQMVWNNKMPVPSIKNGRQKTAASKDGKKAVADLVAQHESQFSVNDFSAEDWEWNYHPRKGFYTKTKDKLTLKAFKPLREGDLLKAGNTLTMRSYQTPWNEASVRVDLSKMEEGQRTGICHFSAPWSEFGVEMKQGKRVLYHRTNNGDYKELAVDVPGILYLRSSWGLDARCRYAYSMDGKAWTDCGVLYQLQWGHYRGDRLGLFTYNDKGEQGEATFTQFHYTCSEKMPAINYFGDALVPDMIADASIQKIGDTYYCYATTDGYGRGLDTSGPAVVWKSRDFRHWSFDGGILPQYESEKFWAPSKAVQANGVWYLYPTINGYMYPLMADSPDGPFALAKGNDLEVQNRLLEKDRVHAIDTEIFIDDADSPAGKAGTTFAFWGSRNVARLKADMVTIDTKASTAHGTLPYISTRRGEYSEGPIFFKRNGIYYFLYTIGGDERYEYYYQMSRVSPLGPWETPGQDLVCTTDWEEGVFGPGHGCVFNDGDDYYLAFLEFGRRSTNRMTYVNKLEFNDDGTIRQVRVTLDGVGYLHQSDHPAVIEPVSVKASSEAHRHLIQNNQDWRCWRMEQFLPQFAIDDRNGSRWMAADADVRPTLTLDLGSIRSVGSSEIAFVRPTAGHAYILEGSADGEGWQRIGGHSDVQKRSPHVDSLGGASFCYLRLTITHGVKGIYEWRLYE